MRFCESEWERIRRRERERERQKVSKRISRIEQGNQWQLSRSRRESTLLPVCHMIVFFFFFDELNKKRQEVSMREKYTRLFEALLFTVDILTMINTFVYFFSRNFFSRPRGRCSIIDFVILGNYSLEERNHRFVGLLIYPSNGSLEVKYWFYWFSFYRNFVPWDKIFINQIILYDDKSHLNIAMK